MNDHVQNPVIEVSNLSVTYATRRRFVKAVDSVSFSVNAGDTLAVVGESGSGKSTVVQSLLGILPPSASVSGSELVLGHELVQADNAQIQAIRGRIVGFVPQDPGTSLDPTMRIGAQLAEIVTAHNHDLAGSEAHRRALQLLREVGIDEVELRAWQYPHELSGGLKQRVLIAAALASDPQIIIADEPTSALDVTVQKTVLDLLSQLVKERGISLVIVTHDLGVALDRAEHVIVMHHGTVVERGESQQVLLHPEQEYTRRLIAAVPTFAVIQNVQTKTEKVHSEIRQVEKAVVWDRISKKFGSFQALNHIDLTAREGRTLAIVGESGSGKSTLLKLALGLEAPSEGTVLVKGSDVNALKRAELKQLRRTIQLVQQNPLDSIDPRYSVAQAIQEPLDAWGIGKRADRAKRVAELIDQVSLPVSIATVRASELSGGQCQRVAIARALALNPSIVLLDEPVSALDVSVQARILDLLGNLQRELKLTYVLVSHDLAVVAQIAHDVAVLDHGELVEFGQTSQVLTNPEQAYTRMLINAIPGRQRLAA